MLEHLFELGDPPGAHEQDCACAGWLGIQNHCILGNCPALAMRLGIAAMAQRLRPDQQ
jgi:hypothetical protein